MKNEKEKKVTVALTPEVLAGIEDVRKAKGGVTRSSVVRLALAEFLAKHISA